MPRKRKLPKVDPRAAAKRKGKDKAWKCTEREVARFFGTERAPLGQKGQDTREVPELASWLETLPPDQKPIQTALEKFTHVFVESKCHLSLMPTLEKWKEVVFSNYDRKELLPLMVSGDIGQGNVSGLLGCCLLENFGKVYRAFLSPKEDVPAEIWFANMLNRFYIVRSSKTPTDFLYQSLRQAETNAETWKNKKTLANRENIRPLAILYIDYPKHMKAGVVFRLPSKNI